MKASTTASTTTASKAAFTPALAVLGLALLAPVAQAQQDLEPAVQTSPVAPPGASAATQPARRSAVPEAAPTTTAAPPTAAAPAPAAALAPQAGPGTAAVPGPAGAPAKGTKASDRIQLETTQISGNRELPRVMYVVPWRRPDPGEFSGRPPNSLLDEALTPVDRDVFRRQNRYYSALAGEPGAPDSQPGAAATGVATPTPKDEK